MKSIAELSLLIETIPYRKFDSTIFHGMQCVSNSRMATISEIKPSCECTMFEVEFLDDRINKEHGSDMILNLIEWPELLEISMSQICSILSSTIHFPPNSKKTGAQIFLESAQIQAMVDKYNGVYMAGPEDDGFYEDYEDCMDEDKDNSRNQQYDEWLDEN